MKRSVLLTAVLIVAVCFCGCGRVNDGAGGDIYTVISEDPQNLDPQLAEDSASMSVICNIFEGLTEVSADGEIHCAAAKSCTVSEDRLKYSFTLREGIAWKGAEGFTAPLTAHDYVYAFRRIFDPDIHSPYANTFAAIKNSAEVYGGVMSPTDLGVRAEGDDTVIFELSYPVSDFLYLLSTAAASPCCEEFYLSTEGRYGLSAEYTAGNGAFVLTEWNYDPYWNENFLTLKRNSDNSTEERKTYPSYVHYIITDNAAEYEEGSGNTIDVQVCAPGGLPRMKNRRSAEYPSYAAGLTFNPHDPVFSNYSIRSALSLCTDISVYDGNTTYGISAGSGAVPYAVTVEGKPLRELFGEFSPRSGGAYELWQKGIEETGGNYPELETVIVPDSFADAAIVYMLTDSWNEELGFSCGVEILSDSEYESRMESGDYSIALTRITADTACAADFLDEYRRYILDPDTAQLYASYVAGGRYTASVSSELKNYREAEQLLIDSSSYIPVFYESRLLVTEKDISGVLYDPFTGAIDFKNVKKFDD